MNTGQLVNVLGKLLTCLFVCGNAYGELLTSSGEDTEIVIDPAVANTNTIFAHTDSSCFQTVLNQCLSDYDRCVEFAKSRTVIMDIYRKICECPNFPLHIANSGQCTITTNIVGLPTLGAKCPIRQTRIYCKEEGRVGNNPWVPFPHVLDQR